MNTSLNIPAMRLALCVAAGALAPVAFAQMTLSSSEAGSGFSNPVGSNYSYTNSGDPDTLSWGTGVSNGLGSNVIHLDRVNNSAIALPTTGALVKVASIDYTNTHTTGGVLTSIDYTLHLDLPDYSPAAGSQAYAPGLNFTFTLTIDTTIDPNNSGPQTPDRIKWTSSNENQLINLGGTNYLFSFSFGDSSGSFLETENTFYSVDESYYSNNRGGNSYSCGGDYQTPVWGKDASDIFVSVIKPTGTPNTGSVPEPSTYGLLGACAALALVTVRRATRK